MRHNLVPARNKRLAYVLYAVAAFLLAGSFTVAAMHPAAADATGWGPDGTTGASDSAVTVQWDNGGATPAADEVPRDATQVLAHTGGKTYADVDPALNAQMQKSYGGAQLTVSQTTGLVHQAVTLTLSGVVGVGSNTAPSSLTVMQCWGSADQPQPDPQNCQDGGGVVDTSNTGFILGNHVISPNDADLIAGGDYKASTLVTLHGETDGTGATIEAFVTAQTQDGTLLATGAAGQVEFDDANGNAVATVPVSGGKAEASIASLPSGGESYTAKYLATADESFTSSLNDSNAVSLPAQSTDLDTVKPPAGDAGTNSDPDRAALIPFQAIGGTFGNESQFFGQTTTNEIGYLSNGSEPFEMQTGAEAAGLGCGSRSDQPSTAVCWLVAVPSNFPAADGYSNPNTSPLTPSLWAQRMQVKLSFADVATSCGSGARELSVGSEMLLDAMNSWIPALCTSSGIDLGYIQTDDTSARSQLTTGGSSIVFSSQPVDDSGGGTSTLYAPAGLSSVTIGVLSAQEDLSAGIGFKPVTGIKLNARLVAKLLTESYQDAIDAFGAGTVSSKDIPWQSNLPFTLAQDPEFQALNPGLPLTALGSDLVVTASGSDATSALWNWIVGDPEAKAFLDGCPDSASNNTTINPFYSTRSYTECPSDKDTLGQQAAAERAQQSASNPDGTVLPGTFTDSVPSYPPVGGVFPQPGYYERPAITDSKGNVTQLSNSLGNLHPQENTFSAVATDVLRGQEKSLDSWCNTEIACPGTVVTAPGIWINGNPPSIGNGVFGLTDGTSAAKDTLPTTLLCDDSGSNCVGADNASLTEAAGKFTPSSADSHFQSLDAASFAKDDWYADGAYPLTIPVYAEINTKGLNQQTAQDYAKVLTYISTTGQQQGFDIGNLPPGMAPLTDPLVAQDQTAIATLNQIKDASPATSSSPPTSAGQPPDNPVASSGGNDNTLNPGQVPLVGSLPSVGLSAPAASAKPGASFPAPQAQAVASRTPATGAGLYPFAVGGGLAGALASGVAAPIVGRRRRRRRA